MENVAHSGVGWRIGQLDAFRAVGRRAPLIGLLAANLPDLDVLLYAWNRDVGTWQHRGFTHSFLGWPLFALIGAAISRRWTGEGRYRDHLGLWAAGLLSHALLDWPTTWGTQLLWPLSDHRFGLEWIFIVDPMFWVCAWALPWGLGRGGDAAARSRAATVGLLALSAWILGSGMLKELAVAAAPEPVVAFPAPGAPFFWTGVTPSVPADPQVRRYWLTLTEATPAGTFAAARGPHVDQLRSSHVGERDLWMCVAPVLLVDEPTTDGGAHLGVVDLAYTNWLQPDTYRFGHAYMLSSDGTILDRDAGIQVALGR